MKELFFEKRDRGIQKKKLLPDWLTRKPPKKNPGPKENPLAKRSHTNGK